MARTSLSAAKAELFALLCSGSNVPTVAGIKAAYDHDPGPGRALGPVALLLTTAAIDPDFWSFAIRLYADIGADPAGVQASLDTIMPAVSAVVSARYGSENWTGPFPHPDRDDVAVCEWIVQCGRED